MEDCSLLLKEGKRLVLKSAAPLSQTVEVSLHLPAKTLLQADCFPIKVVANGNNGWGYWANPPLM